MKLSGKKIVTYIVDENKYVEYAKKNPPLEITVEYINDDANEVVVKMEEGEFVGDPSKITLRNDAQLKLFDKERYMRYSDDDVVAFWELNKEEFLDKLKKLGDTAQTNKIIPHHHSVGLKSGDVAVIEIIVYISDKTKEIAL